MKAIAQRDELLTAWRGLRKSAPFFGPIRNERDYARMQFLMEMLLAGVGDDEDHPLADLLDVVGVLVSQYEDENTPGLQPAEPVDVLRFLMEQHDLSSPISGRRSARKASSPRFFPAAARSTRARPRHWPSGLVLLQWSFSRSDGE